MSDFAVGQHHVFSASPASWWLETRNREVERGRDQNEIARLEDERRTTLPGMERYQDRIAIKSDGITRFLKAGEIDWIEAAGVYVTLHVGGKEFLHRRSLASMLLKLDPRRFVRVHRSAIVNIESIVQLEALSHGEFEAATKHGGRLRVSRTFRSLLERRLGESL